MQLDAPTAPAPASTAYTQQLAAARDELAFVRRAPLDTPQRVDIALGHLYGASSSLHEALAGAARLPGDLPGGATSFPRQATELLRAAADEVQRGTRGLAIDVPTVERNVDDAIGRLQQAIGLVAHPPSSDVFDGS